MSEKRQCDITIVYHLAVDLNVDDVSLLIAFFYCEDPTIETLFCCDTFRSLRKLPTIVTFSIVFYTYFTTGKFMR